jgi:2-dehydro-3-deoxygalactonokinase
MGGRMRGPDGFIAVDWGTTNRRAYRIDAAGTNAEEFEDSRGILAVGKGEFPQAIAEIRERLGDLPLLLAGMIGSNRGWVEAPYVPCPAGIEALAQGIVWAGEREAIVPGVSFVGANRADIMRGEEVQLLGAVTAKALPDDCVVCHPGTHNKWVTVAGGRIESFRTVMTGELFNLLREHSILADLLGGQVRANEAFRAGAAHGLSRDDLLSELFAIRARVLLGQGDRSECASYASGLLIGSDVRIGLESSRFDEVIVMGRPDLTTLYAAAIDEAGKRASELDGEQSFLAGIVKIAEMI